MNRLNLLLAFACLAIITGCSYRGAVYSEYSQVGLDVRTTQASNAPIMVNFGYDRGVWAYVPKRNADANSTQGEAVSVISWNNLSCEPTPTKIGTETLLKVDAGFISGIAANVASVPAGTTVVIKPGQTTEGAKKSPPETRKYEVNTLGRAGERIGAAVSVFKPSARFQSEQQSRLQTLLDQIQSRPDRANLFERAAKIPPQEFEDLYQKVRGSSDPPVAFLAAKNRYLGKATEGPKYEELIEALQTVLK